ncbi:MAG: HAD family hydrolase [Candidatus Aminicenantes bacterium]|nr:MAG: HAD family hydrolase [Candidatus Aminicenantes bacterium]
MDGTVVDVPYDWKRIKQELQTQGEPILSHIQSLREPERSKKWAILERFEEEATAQATLKEGMEKFLAFLKKKRIKTALVTNNSRKNLEFLLNKFRLSFDLLLSREAGLWKPSGAPFLFVLKNLGIRNTECCVIGDSHFDVKAAESAGIKRIFVLTQKMERQFSTGIEIVSTVKELEDKISNIL